MTKVFFGGSRKLSHLNRAIRERADNIVDKGFEVLIGDANGADKAMQKYLVDKRYKNVIVFCMSGTCRNNLGNWQTKDVASNRNKKDFDYFAAKDREMSEQADYGFMLWDGRSKGTLNNIINLLQGNKYVLVYFSPSRKLFTLKSPSELENLLQKCDPVSVRRFNHTLRITERLMDANAQGQLKLA
ncbi:MAG: hypothetical protein HY607_03300 [Planctomycetes bacterium]|nr:hypothetical protein [Planctomycetota bacterium]